MASMCLTRLLLLIAVLRLLCAAHDRYSHGSSELDSTIVSMYYENENIITTTVDVFNKENIALKFRKKHDIVMRETRAVNDTSTETYTTQTNTTTTEASQTTTATTTATHETPTATESTTTLLPKTTNETETTRKTTPTITSTIKTSPTIQTTTTPTMTTTISTTTTTTIPTTTTIAITATIPTTTTVTTISTLMPLRTKYPVQNPTNQGGCPLGYELHEEEAHGHVCMHQCESLACENMGQCVVQIGDDMQSSAVCRCTEESDVEYSGPTCAERHMVPQRERAIILGVLIPVAGLLLLIAVCACYSLKKHRHSFRHNHHDNNL